MPGSTFGRHEAILFERVEDRQGSAQPVIIQFATPAAELASKIACRAEHSKVEKCHQVHIESIRDPGQHPERWVSCSPLDPTDVRCRRFDLGSERFDGEVIAPTKRSNSRAYRLDDILGIHAKTVSRQEDRSNDV